MNVVIDLETLSTEHDAAIVTLGAAFVANNKIVEVFYAGIPVSVAAEAGGDVSVDTLIWWLTKAGKDALLEATYDSAVSTLQLAADETDLLARFSMAVNKATLRHSDGVECCVWGNGSTFDITILESAYKRNGMTPPWAFWAVRDMRTIRAEVNSLSQMLGHGEIARPKPDRPHVALSDAKAEAEELINLRRYVEAVAKDYKAFVAREGEAVEPGTIAKALAPEGLDDA